VYWVCCVGWVCFGGLVGGFEGGCVVVFWCWCVVSAVLWDLMVL
jgi:hypothetical protein